MPRGHTWGRLNRLSIGAGTAVPGAWGGGRTLDRLLAGLLLLGGATFGALAVGGVGPAVRTQLTTFLRGALQAGVQGGPQTGQVFLRALEIHAGAVFLLWVGGLTALGLAIVPAVLFFRGFSLGFTAGFLVYAGGWAGLVFVGASLLPAQVVLAPIWLGLGGASLRSAGELAGQRLGGSRVAWRGRLGSLGLWALAAAAAVVVAGLLDAYVGPLGLSAVWQTAHP